MPTWTKEMHSRERGGDCCYVHTVSYYPIPLDYRQSFELLSWVFAGEALDPRNCKLFGSIDIVAIWIWIQSKLKSYRHRYCDSLSFGGPEVIWTGHSNEKRLGFTTTVHCYSDLLRYTSMITLH